MFLYKDNAVGPLHLLRWVRLFLFLIGSKEETLILNVDLFIIVVKLLIVMFLKLVPVVKWIRVKFGINKQE